jgi:ACR3 family arsenite transporter
VAFPTWEFIKSVLIFLGIPPVADYLTRRIGLRVKGRDWYDTVVAPRIGPPALHGLLFTIVVMFALQGDAIVGDPLSVVRIAAQLLM